MIISKSKSGLDRKMLFNESFLMVDREDSLSIFIEELKLTMNFGFSNEGTELSTTGKFDEQNNSLDLILHKWNNGLGSEVTNPIELNIGNEKKVWIKFKTLADNDNPFRTFQLTVWLQI